MQDDMSIILAAYRETQKGVSGSKKKKQVVQDIFDDGLSHFYDGCETDALAGVVKKIKTEKRHRHRRVSEWEYKDFLSYFNSLLSNYGVTYERLGPRVDLLSMGKVYDRMVELIGYDMNEEKLKEYLEWWTNMYAERYHDNPLKVSFLTNEHQIQKFIKRIAQSEDSADNINTGSIKSEPSDISAKDIYDLGGLPALLMEKGIVVAWEYLKRTKQNSTIQDIFVVLETFSKEVLENTMKITIDNAPYDMSQKIDFVELAYPLLDKFNLEAYKKLSCATHFRTA